MQKQVLKRYRRSRKLGCCILVWVTDLLVVKIKIAEIKVAISPFQIEKKIKLSEIFCTYNLLFLFLFFVRVAGAAARD